jgi:RNA polymerase sigma factor (sigma-70 family)
MTREQLFLSELPLIRRTAAWVCARRGLRGADAEDFTSTVLERLVEDDYAILGKFQGRSSLKTYLTAVIVRFYLDFQEKRFGKWRPSAEALRRGPLALRLERLLYRDGLTFDEACGVLASDPVVTESRDTLYALCRAIPARAKRARPEDPGSEGPSREEPSLTGDGPSLIEQAERQALADRTFAALRRALGRLPAPDRILLRLHVERGFSLAEVARLRGGDQKALYRRRDILLKRLRLDLLAEGTTPGDVHELLSTLDWDAALQTDTSESASPADAEPDLPPRGDPDGSEGGLS